jgi:hypothetical protein
LEFVVGTIDMTAEASRRVSETHDDGSVRVHRLTRANRGDGTLGAARNTLAKLAQVIGVFLCCYRLD